MKTAPLICPLCLEKIRDREARIDGRCPTHGATITLAVVCGRHIAPPWLFANRRQNRIAAGMVLQAIAEADAARHGRALPSLRLPTLRHPLRRRSD